MAKGNLRLVCVAGVLLLMGGALCLLLWAHRGEGGVVGLDRTTSRPPAGTNADAVGGANLRGSGETKSEPVPSQPPPGPRGPGWSCEVLGRVVGRPETGSSVASRCTVAITVGAAAPAAELPVAADGTFRGSVALPEPQATLSCIARDSRGRGVSVLQRRRVVSGQQVGLVFYLVEGAAILARAVDAGGQPVPGAAIRVLERPSKENLPLRTWAVESVLPAAQVVRCEEDGRVRIAVRPGQVWLRPLAQDGSWGAVEDCHVKAGETLDVGDVRLPDSSVPIRGTIVDAVSGDPVAGAWIHMDGQVVRWRADGQPAASIHSDAAGAFAVPNLSAAALPIHAAVGSPTHEAAEVVFRGGLEDQDLLIELQPRPTLRIRLSRGGSEMGAEGAEVIRRATWSVRNVRRHGGRKPAGHGASSIYWIRDALLHTRTHVQAGPDPSEAHCRPPSAGEYEIRMSLPGGARSVARANVEAGESKIIKFKTPEVSSTKIRFHVAQDPAERSAKGPTIQLNWLAAQGEVLMSAGEFDYVSGGDSLDLTLWRPAGAMGLQVIPLRPGISPYGRTTVVLDTSPDSLTHVRLERRSDTALLELQLVYAGDPIPMGETLIWVVPSDPGSPGRLGRTSESDATGHAVLWVPPGKYRALSLKRFGPPKWVDVTAGPGQVSEVLVPVEP